MTAAAEPATALHADATNLNVFGISRKLCKRRPIVQSALSSDHLYHSVHNHTELHPKSGASVANPVANDRERWAKVFNFLRYIRRE